MRSGTNTKRAIEAVRIMREISETNGNRDMTLEEINAEIASVRRGRKKRAKN